MFFFRTLGVFAMLYVVFLNVYQYYTLVIEDVVIRSRYSIKVAFIGLIKICFIVPHQPST